MKTTTKPDKLMSCFDRGGAAIEPLSPASPGLLVCFYMCARVGVNKDTPVTPVTMQEIRGKVGFPLARKGGAGPGLEELDASFWNGLAVEGAV